MSGNRVMPGLDLAVHMNSLVETLRSGAYHATLLSTGNLIVTSADIEIPCQLKKTLERKHKYASVLGKQEFSIEGSGPHEFALVQPKHSVFLDFRSLGATKVYSSIGSRLAESYLRGRKQISNLYLSPELTGLRYDRRLRQLTVQEDFVIGNWVGDLDEGFQNRLANSLLKSADIVTETVVADLSDFFEFAERASEKLLAADQPSPLGAQIIEAVSNEKVMASFRTWVWQHRDFSAHNVSVSGDSFQVIDLSPIKIGLAPKWYDFITFISSQASEYDNPTLVRNYWRGEFDCALEFICPGVQIEDKEHMLILATLLMAYLPFKIRTNRISSWLAASFIAQDDRRW